MQEMVLHGGQRDFFFIQSSNKVTGSSGVNSLDRGRGSHFENTIRHGLKNRAIIRRRGASFVWWKIQDTRVGGQIFYSCRLTNDPLHETREELIKME